MLSAVAARKAAAEAKTRLNAQNKPSSKRKASDVEPQDAPPRKLPHTKRAWSPSAPLPLSDDEDEDHEDKDEGLGHEELGFEHDGLPPIASKSHQVAEPLLLSTWQPVKDSNIFALGSDELAGCNIVDPSPARLVALRASDRLAFLGVYALTVLHGVISVAGTTLTPGITHRVFAPWSSPIPILECLAASRAQRSTRALPSRISSLCEQFDALVVLQEQKTGIEGLGRICRTFENVFEPSRAERNEATVDIGLSGIHYVGLQTSYLYPFVVPPSWQNAIENVMGSDLDSATRRVFLVRGAKKSGKSTFSRTLMNALVTKYRKVAFLECDIGQSEFTPGGLVSLNIVSKPVFGPPFTHPSIPYKAHYIGSPSPRDSPSLYIEALNALMQSYNVDVQFGDLQEPDTSDPRASDLIPLVVNTMGWTKGLGADLAQKIMDITQPSDVFDFEAPLTDDWDQYGWDRLTLPLPTGTIPRLHAIQPTLPHGGPMRFAPVELRHAAILSYFHAKFPAFRTSRSDLHAYSWNTSLPLCRQAPYEVAVGIGLKSAALIGPGAEDVVASEIPLVLNGAIVALESHELSFSHGSLPDTGSLYVQGRPPPSPSSSECLGLAFIRSLHMDETLQVADFKLHVLSPIPYSLLTRSHTIVKGSMEMPVWGLLDFREEDYIGGREKQDTPYLRWGKGEGLGEARRRVRRNVIRRGLL